MKEPAGHRCRVAHGDTVYEKGSRGGGADGLGDISRKDNPLLSCPLYNVGDGREKRLRVGMEEIVEYVDGSPHFYSSAKVHDCDAVTHVADY